MADRDQGARRAVATQQAVNPDNSQQQSLTGLAAGGGLAGMAAAARRLIADNSPKALLPNTTSPSQHVDNRIELHKSSPVQVGSDPREPGLKSFASQLPQDLKHAYGVDLQYVRHHKPVDATTREGHFLKAGAQEYFWDPQKGQLLSWNSGAKKWETLLPKSDQGAGQRFLASTAVRAIVDEAISQQLKKPTNPAGVNIAATLDAANELRKGLQEYGSDMEVLGKADRTRLARKESVVDAIAKVCQKDASAWTADERSFMKSKGVNPQDFLRLYKMMCEARDSDAIAREKYRGNPDSEGLVSFHRRHMVDHILDNCFNPSIGRQVTRLKSVDNPDALANYLGIKKLAV